MFCLQHQRRKVELSTPFRLTGIIDVPATIAIYASRGTTLALALTLPHTPFPLTLTRSLCNKHRGPSFLLSFTKKRNSNECYIGSSCATGRSSIGLLQTQRHQTFLLRRRSIFFSNRFNQPHSLFDLFVCFLLVFLIKIERVFVPPNTTSLLFIAPVLLT